MSWTERVISRLARAVLRLQFSEVLVAGCLTDREPQAVIVVSNHVCKWDAVVAYHIAVREKLSFHMLAHPRIVNRYGFMSLAGFVGVPRDDPVEAANVLTDEAARLEADSRALLWVFATGQHTRIHQDASTESGVVAVHRLAPSAALFVMTIRYEFFRSTKPWIWVRIGNVADGALAGPDSIPLLLEEAECALDSDLLRGENAYVPTLQGDSATVVLGGLPYDLKHWNRIIKQELQIGAPLVTSIHHEKAVIEYRGPTDRLPDVFEVIGANEGRLARKHLEEAVHRGQR